MNMSPASDGYALGRRILLPVRVILASSFGSAVALLIYIADRQDARDLARTADLDTAALSERQEQLVTALVDHSARSAACEHLHRHFDLVSARATPTAVLFFDLDRFKPERLMLRRADECKDVRGCYTGRPATKDDIAARLHREDHSESATSLQRTA